MRIVISKLPCFKCGDIESTYCKDCLKFCGNLSMTADTTTPSIKQNKRKKKILNSSLNLRYISMKNDDGLVKYIFWEDVPQN
jgi:hypothetical protein